MHTHLSRSTVVAQLTDLAADVRPSRRPDGVDASEHARLTARWQGILEARETIRTLSDSTDGQTPTQTESSAIIDRSSSHSPPFEEVVPEPGIVMPDELPGNWQCIATGGNRPLHKGGYTLTVCAHPLPSEQTRASRLLARIETSGRVPTHHTITVEPEIPDTETPLDITRLVSDAVAVSDPSSKAAQRAAERTIWNRAVTHLQSVPILDQ